MPQQVDYTNPSNYKKCRKKVYDIHVCMPPKGTLVINSLEQPQLVKRFGRTYFTINDLSRIQTSQPDMYNALQQAAAQKLIYTVCDGQDFVLAGTQGEMWTIAPQKLAQKYVFLKGAQTVAIDEKTLKERSRNGCMNWYLVRTVPDNSEAFACFVPVTQRGQVQTSWGSVLNFNDPGSSHGKGDFIIAGNAGGQPNLNSVYVVNGNVFGATYNNQGWLDYLDKRALGRKSITEDKLPNLIPKTIENANSIYRVVAKKAIMQWEGKSESEANQIIKSNSIMLLENNHVWGMTSIVRGIIGMTDYLGITENTGFTPSYISEHLLADDFVIEQQLATIKSYFRKDKSMTVLKGLEAIHAQWCIDNVSKFNKEGRETKKYQHLGFYLIGWKEAKLDLLFLRPVLDILGIDVNDEELGKKYYSVASSLLRGKEPILKEHIYNNFNSHLGVPVSTFLASQRLEGSDFGVALMQSPTLHYFRKQGVDLGNITDLRILVSILHDFTDLLDYDDFYVEELKNEVIFDALCKDRGIQIKFAEGDASQVKSEKSTTIFFKYDFVKDALLVKASRNGNSVDRSYKMKGISRNNLLAVLLYLDICTDLKVTPFRYMCRFRFIASQLKCYNETNASTIKMHLNPQRFEKDCFTNCLASARFQVKFNDTSEQYRDSIYTVEMKNILDKNAIKEIISSLRKFYDYEASDEVFNSFADLNKYKLGIKVANATVIEAPMFDTNSVAISILNGFMAERNRQKSSNTMQAQRRAESQ